MRTTIAARAGRMLGRMAAVALVALLLAGLAATPAGAKTRDDGRKEANDFIDWCFGAGGNPEVVYADGDYISVTCYFPNGDRFNCTFYPSSGCRKFRYPGASPGDLPVVDIEQTDAPVVRPELGDPTLAVEAILTEDGAIGAPLLVASGASSRITVLGGSAVADVITVPALAEDEIVTTQPVPAPAAEEIIVPELAEDTVGSIPPAPVAEVIPVPELEEDAVGSIPPAPVAEVIPVPELEEDAVGSIPPVPVADEQP